MQYFWCNALASFQNYFGEFLGSRFFEDRGRSMLLRRSFFSTFLRLFGFGFDFFGLIGVLNPVYYHDWKDFPLFSISAQSSRVSATRFCHVNSIFEVIPTIFQLCWAYVKLWNIHISRLCSKGELNVFCTVSCQSRGCFSMVCSMGKMVKFSSIMGKREDLKKRSQFLDCNISK